MQQVHEHTHICVRDTPTHITNKKKKINVFWRLDRHYEFNVYQSIYSYRYMNHNLDIFSNNNFLLEQSLDPQAEAEVPTLARNIARKTNKKKKR